eukprot:7071995-Heterocapsa_arctica.AAC.1
MAADQRGNRLRCKGGGKERSTTGRRAGGPRRTGRAAKGRKAAGGRPRRRPAREPPKGKKGPRAA